MKLTHFKDINFLPAIKALFKELNVPMNYVADEPTTAKEILKDTYKENETFQLVDDVYFVGMVDDAAFEGNQSLETEKIKSDYDGILIFGVTLNQRPNNLLPTRSQLAEISRAFNREFYYTPVVLVFKYRDDQKEYLAFANTERLKYKQEWREGEKAGKVSLLRDIDIQKPHAGHERIIAELQIPLTGKNAVDSFAKLYNYWQQVFDVSILNKKFYQELSNWYFWAINHVKFPSEPTIEDAHRKDANLDDLIKEHNATNVIRLLTRLLFTWFIKEKKLVPDELFDLDALQKNILNEISPFHENGMFKDANKESVYYKAILQNLFFASLNCPIEADETDSRVRQFRGDETYGKHRGIDWMMRYKKYFKNPDAFLQLMNKTVPFLNGGLFECLDDKTQNLYVDGFSDHMTKGEQLVVPDYLFFGATEHVDLSPEYGVKNKGTKQAAVKGLINILHSYKFTVTENTPVEEDVALDPELLGKVFENLLASYNPETKTTARKQTGSFYTPREIVNYMVDESLIAYLKNSVTDWNLSDEELDEKLHQLSSFDPGNPFAEDKKRTKQIVKAIDECKILDPACGSGAFPMGILQKMVHMLQKLDPDNTIWKEVQKNKAKQAADTAYEIEDTEERRERLREIDEAFDRSINDPDYARKLYLIENCIYGVDIQPIATQISKLRFFISLVVDQRKNENKTNFGIRALPNLETKFVAANTLIGVKKDQSLFYTDEIKSLEIELRHVRQKMFGLKDKKSKLRWRKRDEELRNKMAEVLKEQGLPLSEAEKLATWDPYDQNATSTFFDPEWMFDISDGFSVVIGNPPYIKEYTDKSAFNGIRGTKYYQGKMDIWYAFACISIDYLDDNGLLCFIATNNWVTNAGASILRDKVLEETQMLQLLDFGSYMIFESAAIQTMILLAQKLRKEEYVLDHRKIVASQASLDDVKDLLGKNDNDNNSIRQFKFRKKIWEGITLNFENAEIEKLLEQIREESNFELDAKKEVAQGIVPNPDVVNSRNISKIPTSGVNVGDGVFVVDRDYFNDLQSAEKKYVKPLFEPYLTERYKLNENDKEVIYIAKGNYKNDAPNLIGHLKKYKPIMDERRENQNGRLDFFHLHWPRNQFFFEKGPKILSVRKCARPNFIYTENEAYVMMAFNVIKSDRINLKYLTGLLNSKLIEFWLRYKGKMQGDQFQVDKAPILEIPIYKPSDESFAQTIVECIIFNRSIDKTSILFEQVLDAIIFNLYFPDHMKEREIDVLQFVERDMQKALQGREFDSLDDTEKEKVIEQLHATWSDPESEVVKRMAQFKEKSPDILKPILES